MGRAKDTGVVPGSVPTRFPGYDVMAQAGTWDTATTVVVQARLGSPPALAFFTPDEEATGTALFDQVLDQRTEPKIPVLAMVDARLAAGSTDGWRHEDMPADGEAFRHSLAALDADALAAYGDCFPRLSWDDQADVLQRVQDRSGSDWHGLSAKHLWDMWTRYACTAFYSHPWAWNEIGFGGPAYPRGYKNLGIDAREPWEVADVSGLDPAPWADYVESARRRSAGRGT